MTESDNLQRSIIRIISMGIVAENKPLDTPLIQVHPLEMLNLMDGELTGGVATETMNGLNEDGTLYNAVMQVGGTIEAEWWGETNRLTPPDVRRGEQVFIWQSGASDKYYWTTTGRNEELRRLETVLYRWSAFPENADEEITGDNSYYFEVSTHRKLVTFSTSQRNGELTRYTFQFNTGDGQVTLKDTLGNIIQMDSKRTNILVKNALNSLVELNKKNIYIKSPDLINNVTKDVLIQCKTMVVNCTDFTVNADNISLNASSSLAVSGGGGGTSMSGETIEINGTDNISIVSKKTLHLEGDTDSLDL